MAKNLKRVTRSILYRHLGEEAYHAIFLSDGRRMRGRSMERHAKVFEFTMIGREWWALFEEKGLQVEHRHRVYDRGTGVTVFSGKEEVRKELLLAASKFAKKDDFIPPGFKCIWTGSHRGSASAANVYLTGVSHRLAQTIDNPAWLQAESEGVRCPDCDQTRCDEDCPGVS